MTALLAKAAALALAAHPVVNASCKDGQSFTYNSSVNVAVAVALDGGLLTPVLADADKVCAVDDNSELIYVSQNRVGSSATWGRLLQSF